MVWNKWTKVRHFNFEWESCRVTEDDSNDKKSGTEVDSCVKGSQTRKAVPPPEDKILLEPLRAVMAQTILWRWHSFLRGVLISEWCGGVQFRSSAAVVVGLIQVSVRQRRSGLWVSIRSDSAAE